jgi:gluconolactonase
MTAVKPLASGFLLAEAPTLDGAGNLWVADTLGGGIRILAADGSECRILPDRRGIGGMALHADGDVLVSGRDIVAVRLGRAATTQRSAELSATVRAVLSDPRATGFNDLGAGPGGELLCGVLTYRPLRGDPPAPGRLRVVTGVADHRDIDGEVWWPNGVAVDSGLLYLSDFATGTVLRAGWAEGSRLQPWWSSPSGEADGLAVDASGAVLVALGRGAGVARVLPDGTLDTVIEVPASFVASVCFAGPDLDRLIVTTADNTDDPALGGCVFETKPPVPGAALPRVSVPVASRSEES